MYIFIYQTQYPVLVVVKLFYYVNDMRHILNDIFTKEDYYRVRERQDILVFGYYKTCVMVYGVHLAVIYKQYILQVSIAITYHKIKNPQPFKILLFLFCKFIYVKPIFGVFDPLLN